jgi:hypothetical protein
VRSPKKLPRQTNGAFDQDREPADEQTNGICERFHRTVLDEFYRLAFCKKIDHTIDELQVSGFHWVDHDANVAPKVIGGLRGDGGEERRMAPEEALGHVERLYEQRRAFGRDAFEQAAGVILDLGNFSQEGAERVRQRIAELVESLPIVLTSSSDVAAAEQLCRQAAARLRGATGYMELVGDWPAPIAHEVQQLTVLLAGEGRAAPAPEAALLQLRDTAETLVKLPASILARRLIERDGEDAQEMRRRLAGVIGGSWNELAPQRRGCTGPSRRAPSRG